MAKRSFLERHQIIRAAIKKDLLQFALPALLIFTVGLIITAFDGWDGLLLVNSNPARQLPPLFRPSLLPILGLALIAIGFLTSFIAYFTLQASYSSTLVIRQDHQLITHGIYRYTRHPIYLGVLIVAFGLPLFAVSFFGLLTMAALIPVFLNRIRLEEQLLTEHFGEAYRTYAEHTAKVLPFIY